MICLIYTVGTGNKALVMTSLTLFSVCNLIAFPLLIEFIAKRIGSEYLVMGTGMLFFISQGCTAVSSYLMGLITNSQTQISTLFALTLPIGIALIGLGLSVMADINMGKKFETNVKTKKVHKKSK